MTKSDAQARVAELSAELDRHNRLYYLEAQPEVSDADYDRLMNELEQMRDGLVVYNQGSKERIQKEQEIERKRLEFEQQGRLLQMDLDMKKTKILQEAVAEIEATVGRYSEDKGLDVVLAAPFSISKVSAKDPTDVLKWLNEADVVWSNDALDITDAILTIVNGS